ncbi:hypothetical protein V5O48_010866 [Marasmius crinis-equi]|uniref:Homeobox domain-containing protein n=1 Tax=Marasmius crinis-equi TaxID=585013 RepID=A0ABR3F776_9AGAR
MTSISNMDATTTAEERAFETEAEPTTPITPIDASSSAFSTANAKPPKPKRVTKEGSKVLTDAFDSGITHPTGAQKAELLEKIHACPGNDHYTVPHITRWFISKRKSVKSKAPDVVAPDSSAASTSHSSRSLTPEHVAKLNTLFHKGNTDPPQELIDMWATLLQVDSASVTAWVNAEREKIKLASAPAPSRPPPPSPRVDPGPHWKVLTPVTSTSPEPDVEIPLVKQERQPTEDAGIPSQAALAFQQPQPPPPLPQAVGDPIRRKLLLSIHDKLSDPQHTQPSRVRSREEFEALSNLYTQPMKKFLNEVENGSLEKFGFKRGVFICTSPPSYSHLFNESAEWV